jgi:hypothetical protein
MLVVMADFHVTSGSQGDLRAAIGHIPDIGPVNSVVLSPSNPQVMIRGTNGNINVDAGTNPLHGISRGVAEYLAGELHGYERRARAFCRDERRLNG